MRTLKRFENEILGRELLIAYSFYLNEKINLLLSIADEIVGLLDEGFSESVINGSKIGRASRLTWFWILGAYEIVRTMAQSEDCFSEKVNSDLVQLEHLNFAKIQMLCGDLSSNPRRGMLNDGPCPQLSKHFKRKML